LILSDQPHASRNNKVIAHSKNVRAQTMHSIASRRACRDSARRDDPNHLKGPSVKKAFRLAPVAAALFATASVHAQQTPINHVIVLFQENVSFDHYFGTYPNAQNNPGETPFSAVLNTPTVNGLTPELLLSNPNRATSPTNQTTTFGAQANPQRLSPAQAYTCSVNHNYGPEQSAVDSGLMDKFPQFTGRTTSEGCTADGTTVMNYFDGNTVTALWNYAQNFAMSDNSFGTTFGPSTPGAINLISGQTYGGNTHFGSGSTASYPNAVTSPVTDIGDFDAYLDDCGADKGGTVTTTTTLEMSNGTTVVNKNVGDLLNAANVTWGWFQGGFAPTTAAVYNATTNTWTPAVCGSSHTTHTSMNRQITVPNPVAPLITGADIHTLGADYVSHHEPFQFYASTRNPHHLRPTSTAAIGTTDQANHQYDTSDFFAALNNGNLPAVSFVKSPYLYNGHPSNSDPIMEQVWITQVVNAVMQSSAWPSTAIIIAYDDSDGWYDHVTGPIVSPSNVTISGQAAAYDNFAGVGNCGTPQTGAYPARCGHGPRLPLLVISPYTNVNYVDHNLTDQTSIINFIESNWNLGYIDGPAAPANGTASFDRNAGSLNGLFNFSAPPNLAPVLLKCNGDYAPNPAAACQVGS
jgi:phospholipase C